MYKSIEEINYNIKKNKAVILTASEFKALAEITPPDTLAKKVDVVTTATFGPMCSSGVFLNLGHSDPPMRYEKLTLNDVSAYGGIAAADAYLGATEESNKNPEYGGAHVIEDLLSGKKVRVKASSKGTHCYPRKEIDTFFTLDSINEAIMFNPRNAYQNYAAATNSSDDLLFTYMGTLLPKNGNITFSTSGELSPLLNDPELQSIGIGTKIFLGGAEGFVAFNGTQHYTEKPKNEHNIPLGPSATIAVLGNLKEMSTDYIKAAYYEQYGTSLFVGIGIPIPVTSPDVAKTLSIRNKDIQTTLLDYGKQGRPSVGVYNYDELFSGKISFNGKTINASPLSSLKKAKEICEILKNRILEGKFEITNAVAKLPQNSVSHKLKIYENQSV
ncbi:MAG: homocysteine biosynthesis protein [Bacteroidetes bacterium]|nr:homocysteine biosynthesis protein [Bacteroidota bacterium]